MDGLFPPTLDTSSSAAQVPAVPGRACRISFHGASPHWNFSDREVTGGLLFGFSKNLPANAGDTGDLGLIPGLGRSPGGVNGNLLQYSCRENVMDRRAWLWLKSVGPQSRT